MNDRIDFEGVFHPLPPHGAVMSGYRPQHLLHGNYQSSGNHTYPDQELVSPGESARVQVRLISPEVYPCCIWEGRVLSIFEGRRLVGTLTVGRILNEALRVAPEDYKPKWKEPAHLRDVGAGGKVFLRKVIDRMRCLLARVPPPHSER